MSAGAGWCLLLVLVKLGDAATVGVYALGIAIAGPVSVLTNLGLTGALVTETRAGCPYGAYVALRLLSTVLSIFIISCIAICAGYPSASRWVIVLIGVSVAFTSIREIFLSIMRRYECMNLSGRSQMVTAVLCLVAFAATFWATRSLAWAVGALCVVRSCILLLLDVPVARRLVQQFDQAGISPIWSPRMLWGVGWESAPLAAAMTLTSLISNIPRYVLEARAGTEALGHFSALASLVIAGTLVSSSLGTAVTPRLALYFVKNRRAYLGLVARLLLMGGVIGLTGVAGAAIFGRPILRIVFKPEYAAFDREFVLITVHLAIMLLVSFVNQALVASRAFDRVFWVNLAVCGTSLVFSFWLIDGSGIMGACLAWVLAPVCWLVALSLTLVWRVRTAPVTVPEDAKAGMHP